MISRKLIAALVGLTLLGGTVADASAKVVTSTSGTKTVAAQTVSSKHLRKVAMKRRIHVSHRAIKRMNVAKAAAGKRLVVSHVAKRSSPKHV